jgi:hypothetical protein
MPFFIKSNLISDDLFKLQFSGADLNSLSANIDFTMLKEGYRLIDGQKAFGEYERGNRTLRVLLGAFVKYFKFSVKLNQLNEHEFELLFVSTSTGISGGLIGMGQVKSELQRLAKVFSKL